MTWLFKIGDHGKTKKRKKKQTKTKTKTKTKKGVRVRKRLNPGPGRVWQIIQVRAAIISHLPQATKPAGPGLEK